MKKLTPLLGALCLSLAAGCSSDQSSCPKETSEESFCAKGALLATNAELEAAASSEWVLAEQNIPSEQPLQIPTQRKTTLAAKDGRLYGCSGVNRYGMSVTFTDGKPSFKPGMSTMMAGPEADMRFERAFLKALSSVQTFTLQGDDTLILSSADQPRLLVFTRPQQAEAGKK